MYASSLRVVVEKVGYNESNHTVINDTLIDPQGVFADSKNGVLYFASHSGFV